MIAERERTRLARLYETGKLDPPVRLFVFEGLRHVDWALPRAIDEEGLLREELEGTGDPAFACGALFVSEAAEAALASIGVGLEWTLEGYVGGRWSAARRVSLSGVPEGSMDLRGPYPGGRPVLAFMADPRQPEHASWLAAYTDSERAFTCLATGRESPFALMAPEGEPRLGRPVAVDGGRLFRARRRARLSGPELARRATLPADLVYRLETAAALGDAWTDLHHVRKLARVLNVQHEYLVRWRGGSPYP